MYTDANNDRTGLALDAARRHSPLVLLCGAALAIAGLLLGLSSPPTYTSVATVLVNPVQGAPFGPDSRNNQINLQTEAALVRTQAVAEIAASIMGEQAPDADLRTRVRATVPSSTQVLEIAYTGDSAQEAQQGAQAFADAFLVYRSQRAQESADRRTSALGDQRESLEGNLREATAQLSAAEDGSADQTYLRQLVESYTDQLSVLDAEASGLSDVDVDPGQVISPAEVPSTAGGLGLAVFTGAGLLAGLALGAALAFVRERTDDRIRHPSQIADRRVLAVVPRGRRSAAEPVTVNAPGSEPAEAYRRLRVAVGTSVPAGATLALTSVSSSQSSAVVAANLAVSATRAGSRVVLVDAGGGDEATTLLGVGRGDGLSEALLDGVAVEGLLKETDVGPLALTAGSQPALAGERYLGKELQAVLQDLRSRSDLVLLATPTAVSADGESLASVVDGVILVVTLGHTTVAEVMTAREVMATVGATVIGTVVQARQPGRRGRSRRNVSRPAAAPHTPDVGPGPLVESSADERLHSSR